MVLDANKKKISLSAVTSAVLEVVLVFVFHVFACKGVLCTAIIKDCVYYSIFSCCPTCTSLVGLIIQIAAPFFVLFVLIYLFLFIREK